MPIPPLVDQEPRSLDWRNLPLPARSMRYVVATLLALTIFAVVLITYRRIEQQLQATLEERLTAVLHERKRATLHFIGHTKELTVNAATVAAGSRVASAQEEPQATMRGSLDADTLPKRLN